ncbi:hypothetical protein Q4S45_08370 [Massilia sp. R2A-15]|uniref:hypothetical protein n=1 Tax=Massilia sp. R2A-15 TaxID=3064278 RepID=UPI002736BD84|nr:hypothetical protein [Massilia sp. R2A-15]WLI91120.1 hypothetical protein Q4S45_08370 [Massilia sp. R2A-15]
MARFSKNRQKFSRSIGDRTRVFETGYKNIFFLLNCGAALGGTPSCGLGSPPDAPGFAEAHAQASAEDKRYGHLPECDANLDRYHIAFLPAADQGQSGVPTGDLARTQFAHFESLGAMVDPDKSTRSRLYRGFRMPDGRTVTLFERTTVVRLSVRKQELESVASS